MNTIGLWEIDGERPRRLREQRIALESDLEGWIEHDPSLLRHGVQIVGRQVVVEGGRIDLLALDPQGRWVIIELKAGVLRRETVAQALDYASCLAELPLEELDASLGGYLHGQGTTLSELLSDRNVDATEELESREVIIFVVGTGKDSGLERMVGYLNGQFEIPISVVLFDVFETQDGRRVLVREIAEAETPLPLTHKRQKATLEDVVAQARQLGIAGIFDRMIDASNRHGFYIRPYRRSLMFTPQANRSRMLITLWAQANASGAAKAYLSPQAFSEFFPVDETRATELLGPDGYRWLDDTETSALLEGIDRVFESIHE